MEIKTSATVSSATPRAILNICTNRGVDVSKLTADVGIDSSKIENTSAKIPIEQVFALWSEAQKCLGDGEMISVQAAENAPFGAYKIIDYIFVTGATPREGMAKAFRYFGLINSGFEISFEKRKDYFQLELENPFDEEIFSSRYVEYVFAASLVRLRIATGFNCPPKEIHFKHSAPKNAGRYNKVFHSKVRFNQSANLLIFDENVLSIPQPQADASLCELLEHHAQGLLKQVPAESDDFIGEFRKILREELNRGNANLAVVSRKLAMSRRAVQRRLNSHGTSYRNILDQMRSELSVDFLKQQSADIEELAMLLGFADTCSFYRAFKRWTGKTPQNYLQS